MAIEDEQPHEQVAVGALSEESAEKADSLAPIEEQQADYVASHASFQNDGVLPVNTGKLTLPKGMLEEDQSIWQLLRPEPIVAVILFVVLFFILFITVLIWATSPSSPTNQTTRRSVLADTPQHIVFIPLLQNFLNGKVLRPARGNRRSVVAARR